MSERQVRTRRAAANGPAVKAPADEEVPRFSGFSTPISTPGLRFDARHDPAVELGGTSGSTYPNTCGKPSPPRNSAGVAINTSPADGS